MIEKSEEPRFITDRTVVSFERKSKIGNILLGRNIFEMVSKKEENEKESETGFETMNLKSRLGRLCSSLNEGDSFTIPENPNLYIVHSIWTLPEAYNLLTRKRSEEEQKLDINAVTLYILYGLNRKLKLVPDNMHFNSEIWMEKSNESLHEAKVISSNGGPTLVKRFFPTEKTK